MQFNRSRLQTGSYLLDSGSPSDTEVHADASAGPIAFTMRNPRSGRMVMVRKIDGSPNPVTVAPDVGTIDGYASYKMWAPGQCLWLISDGNVWSVALASPAPHLGAGGVYFEDDLLGHGLQLLARCTGPIESLCFWGVPNSGGIPVLPAGWTAAMLKDHPGTVWCQTKALNDASSCTLSGVEISTTGQYSFWPLFSEGPSFIWSCVFGTPNVLSTPSDRYRFSVGFACLGSLNSGLDGPAYLYYTDNHNGGNWSLAEGLGAREGGNVIIANSNVAPVPATWNLLTIYKPNNSTTLSAYLNGTLLCSGAGFIGNDPMPVPGGGGMWMFRDTFAGGTVPTAFMDKISFCQAANNRIF